MTITHYPFTIDALGRDEAGFWVASLTIYGTKREVDRSQGVLALHAGVHVQQLAGT